MGVSVFVCDFEKVKNLCSAVLSPAVQGFQSEPSVAFYDAGLVLRVSEDPF